MAWWELVLVFGECLCLQTRLNKVPFLTLVCSSVVSGAQTSTASCQLVPDHIQTLAGAPTGIAGLLHRHAPCMAGSKGDCARGDPMSCHAVGGTKPSSSGSFFNSLQTRQANPRLTWQGGKRIRKAVPERNRGHRRLRQGCTTAGRPSCNPKGRGRGEGFQALPPERKVKAQRQPWEMAHVSR